MKSSTTKTYPNASFFKRLAAFYLSVFFVLIATVAIVFLLKNYGFLAYDYHQLDFWLIFGLVFLLIELSDIFFQNILGFNLAKFLLGLRIVQERENQSPRWFQVIIRFFASVLTFITLGLGFLAIAFNKERLAMHDLLSGTKVVDLNNDKFSKIVSWFFVILIDLPGLVLNLLVFSCLIFAPIFLARSLLAEASETFYSLDLWANKPTASLVVPIDRNEKITLMLKDFSAAYVEFYPTPENDRSTLNFKENFSFDLIFLKSKLDIKKFIDTRNFLDNLYIPLAELTIKTLDNQDLSIYNVRFYNGNKNTLARDVFGLFDHNTNTEKKYIELKLQQEALDVVLKPGYQLEEKNYLIRKQAAIETQWFNYVQELPIKYLQMFAQIDESVVNDVELIIDPLSGAIKEAKLIKPSRNQDFDSVCEKFLGDLKPLNDIPDSFKSYTQDITLMLKLYYRELI